MPSKKRNRKKKLSFSAKRLRKEYDLLLLEPLENIDAKPLDLNANIHEWHANISDEDQFQGLHFHLIIQFGNDYPHKPPTVRMCHRFTHASVLDGNICLDMLESEGCWTEEDEKKKKPYEGWSPGYTISSLLVQLQCFLFDTETTGQELTPSLRQGMVQDALNFSCHCGHCAECPKPNSKEVDLFDDSNDRRFYVVVRQVSVEDSRGSMLCNLCPGQLLEGVGPNGTGAVSIHLPVKGSIPLTALETISKAEFDSRVAKSNQRKKADSKKSPFRRQMSVKQSVEGSGGERASPIMDEKISGEAEGGETEEVAISLSEVPGKLPPRRKRPMKRTSKPGEGIRRKGLALGGKKTRRGLGAKTNKVLGARKDPETKRKIKYEDVEDISVIDPIADEGPGRLPPGAREGPGVSGLPSHLLTESVKKSSSEGVDTGTPDMEDAPIIVLGDVGAEIDDPKEFPVEGGVTGDMEKMQDLDSDEDAPEQGPSATPGGPAVVLSRIPMISADSLQPPSRIPDPVHMDQAAPMPGTVTRFDSSPDLHLSAIPMHRSSSLISPDVKKESKKGFQKVKRSPKFQPRPSSSSSGMSDLPSIPGATYTPPGSDSASSPSMMKQRSRILSQGSGANTPGALGKKRPIAHHAHDILQHNVQTPVGPELVLSEVKMAPMNSISHPNLDSTFDERNPVVSSDEEDSPAISLNRPPMISAASLAPDPDEISSTSTPGEAPGMSPQPIKLDKMQKYPKPVKRPKKLSRYIHKLFDNAPILAILCDFLNSDSLFNLRLVHESFGPKMDRLQDIALRSYRCFFTLENACSHHIILGIGVNRVFGKQQNRFARNPKRDGKIILRKIQPRFDLLSWNAFKKQRVKCDIWKQPFTHFMPIYINERHGSRALEKARECIKSIWNESRKKKLVEYVDATCILETIAKIMNSTVVELIASKGNRGEGQAGLHDSIRAMEVYFYLHHLLLAFMKEEPDILTVANAIVHQFIYDEDARDKACVPDLGEFLIFVAVSQYEWSDVAAAYLHESMQRSVRHRLQKYPSLRHLGGHDMMSCHRLTLSWKSSHVGRQVLMFQLSFMNEIGAASGAQGTLLDKLLTKYAERNGKPPPGFASRLQEHIRRIYGIKDWKGFFEEVEFVSPSAAHICNWLRNAVRLSVARKYHTDFDLNRSIKAGHHRAHSQIHPNDRSHCIAKNCMCPGETCKFRTYSWSKRTAAAHWKKFTVNRPDLEFYCPWAKLTDDNLSFRRPVEGKTVRERYDRYLHMRDNSLSYRTHATLVVRKLRDVRSPKLRSIQKGEIFKINRFDQNDKRHALITEPCCGYITVDEKHTMISRVWENGEVRKDTRAQPVGEASKMIFGSYVPEKKAANAWANAAGVQKIRDNQKQKEARKRELPRRQSQPVRSQNRELQRRNTEPSRRRSPNPPTDNLLNPKMPRSLPPGFSVKPGGDSKAEASAPPGSVPYRPLVPVIPSPSVDQKSDIEQQEGSVQDGARSDWSCSDRSNSRMRDADLSSSTFPELVSGEEDDDTLSEAFSEYSDVNPGSWANSAEQISLAAPHKGALQKRDPTKKKSRRNKKANPRSNSVRTGKGSFSRTNSNRQNSMKPKRSNARRRDNSKPCIRMSWLAGTFSRDHLERHLKRQGFKPTRVYVERSGRAAYVDFASHEHASSCLKHAISIDGERLRLEYARGYADYMFGDRSKR